MAVSLLVRDKKSHPESKIGISLLYYCLRISLTSTSSTILTIGLQSTKTQQPPQQQPCLLMCSVPVTWLPNTVCIVFV